MSDDGPKLPILPLKDPRLVVFPGVPCVIDVGRAFSINAVNRAMAEKINIVVAMQQDETVDNPVAKDFYAICTEAEIKTVLPLDDEGIKKRVVVIGIRRAQLKTVGLCNEEDKYLYGSIVPCVEIEATIDEKIQSEIAKIYDIVEKYLGYVVLKNKSLPTDSKELSLILDTIAGQLQIDAKSKLGFLREADPTKRLERLGKLVVDLGRRAKEEGTASASGDMEEGEVGRLRKLIKESKMSDEALEIAEQELKRLKSMPSNMSEYTVTLNYLDNLATLPWQKATEDLLDIEAADKSLNEDHYGLDKAKKRILEFLAVRKLAPKQEGAILCFNGPPGVGKAQPLDAKVLTPTGFKFMGDLSIHDQVIVPSGEVANIIGIFPQGIKDTYGIKFSDGSCSECCKEHLWKVATREDRKNKKNRIVSLEQMMGNLYVENGNRKNYSIKTVGKIDLIGNAPVDPYLFGLLLSEGQTEKVVISNGEQNIIKGALECLPEDCCLKKYSKYDYCIIKKKHNPIDNINVDDNRSSVMNALNELGLRQCLAGTKFIPQEYKNLNFISRERLLQGILDGDGSPVSGACAVEWSSASYRFAVDMTELVQSLGGQARYSCGPAFYTYKGEKLQGQDRHRLRIILPKDVVPFLNSTKMVTYNKNLDKKRDLDRYVSNIEYVGKKEAQCILIDHPDHLYITDNFIITHNTSLGESIAKSMGREFIRMSLGGIHDEAEIRGHRRTYVGAMMGKIMQKIKKIGTNNPVFMLDELDKLCKDFRGDPASALLEVLDPEHNHAFEDNYLNVPFDLSNVFFIGTTNEKTPIPPALRDRMEIIDLPGYSPHDKINIAQDHLVPKQQKRCGLEEYEITISTNALNRIVEEYTSEAGVRNLEREIGAVFRRVAVKVAAGKDPPSMIKVDALPKLLGPPKSFAEKAVEKPEVGLSAGLAWTQHGGCLLFVEGSLYPGKGEIKLTGNLGKVLQESATAAHTWIKSHTEKLGIDIDMITKNDIHIHIPSGAVPKDGPSAGVALASCMVSLFVNKPIRNDVAMTGEITLRGRILPIGGFVEKALAAHRAGMKEVLLPEKNKHDIDELPQDIKAEITVTTVTNLFEALEKLIVDVQTDDTPNTIDPEREDTMINMGT